MVPLGQDNNPPNNQVPAIEFENVNEDAAANDAEQQQNFPIIPPEILEGFAIARPFIGNLTD